MLLPVPRLQNKVIGEAGARAGAFPQVPTPIWFWLVQDAVDTLNVLLFGHMKKELCDMTDPFGTKGAVKLTGSYSFLL